MKQCLMLLFLLFPYLVMASQTQIDHDVRCLTANEGKKINVKFVVIYGENNWSGGYLQYEKSKKPITIIPVEEEVEIPAEGRPAKITTTWLEVIDRRITGEYRTASQGARLYSFEYKSLQKNKTFIFSENTEALSDSDCIWH